MTGGENKKNPGGIKRMSARFDAAITITGNLIISRARWAIGASQLVEDYLKHLGIHASHGQVLPAYHKQPGLGLGGKVNFAR